MTQLFIQNTKPRLHTICVILPSLGAGLAPRRTNIDLQPGVNSVEKSLWDTALQVKAVRGSVEAGILTEMGPTKDGSLADLKETEAVRIIGETYAFKLLRGWFLDEARPKVKAAIQKRLEEIEKAAKPDDDGKKA